MDKARLIALSTVFAWLVACGDSADAKPVDMGMEPVTDGDSDGSPADGSGAADGTGDGAAGDGDGSTTPGDGDGAPGDGDSDGTPGDGDGEPGCVDDPATLGNDCPGQVTCSAAVDSCSLDSQACCVDDYKKDEVSCADGGEQCTGLATALCDGQEDCGGGQLCCISVSLFPMAVEHRCVATLADCSGGQLANSVLCHTDGDCTPDKPSCEAIGEFPWWGICK